MPKFEHREVIIDKPRRRKRTKSPVTTKLRKQHGRPKPRTTNPASKDYEKLMLATDMDALAELSAIPVAALTRMKKTNPGMFIMLAKSFDYKIRVQ